MRNSTQPMAIDLTGIDTKAAFRLKMKRELGFPDWYGVSWDAFWGAIIAVVDMPARLALRNSETFVQACH